MRLERRYSEASCQMVCLTIPGAIVSGAPLPRPFSKAWAWTNPNREPPVAPSITLNEISCTTLLRCVVANATFLHPCRFLTAVLDVGMLHTGGSPLCRAWPFCQAGVLL